jgi:hypothetical protein
VNACENCKFWQEQTAYGGECRRRAPIAVAGYVTAHVGAWPTIARGEWCGEHESGESAENEDRRNRGLPEIFP